MLKQLQNNLGGEMNHNLYNDRLQYLDMRTRKSKDKFKVRIVQPDIAYKYQGNLYGLMIHLGVPPSLMCYTMYANKYTSPHQYDGKKLDILVPDTFPNPL